MMTKLSEFHEGPSTIFVLDHSLLDLNDAELMLTEQEIEKFVSFQSEKRKREFLGARYLRDHLFGRQHLDYTPLGAPYIHDGPFISISHVGKYVALAYNDSFPIGMDIEISKSKILNLYEKFMSDEEIASFDVSDETTLCKIWSAKEALYKLAGRKGIIFKEELLIYKEDESWRGEIIHKEYSSHFNLNIFERNGLICSINNSETRNEYFK